MNNNSGFDMGNLLALLKELEGKTREGTVAPNFGSARPVADNERPGLGIDPRDPNRYSVMPDGSLVGTLMGWRPDGNMPDMSAIAGKPGAMKLPQMGVPGGMPQNAIPKARPNQSGMTRLSPGIYRDKGGKMIRSADGRPTNRKA